MDYSYCRPHHAPAQFLILFLKLALKLRLRIHIYHHEFLYNESSYSVLVKRNSIYIQYMDCKASYTRGLCGNFFSILTLSPSSPFSSGFLYLVLILTCIISFSLIQLYAVQFHLLVTCILFLSREGFRRACLRMDLKW